MTTTSTRPPLLGSSTPAADVAAALGDRWVGGEDPYANSLFLPLKQKASRTKGTEFEKIAEWHLQSLGYQVTRAHSSDYDRLVDTQRVEIKGSFIWAECNTFRLQQIRLDQEYDYLIFLAVYPDRVEYYTCTHADATAALRVQDDRGRFIHNQHGGNSVDSGTFFIDDLPENIPWFKPLASGFPAPSRPLS